MNKKNYYEFYEKLRNKLQVQEKSNWFKIIYKQSQS